MKIVQITDLHITPPGLLYHGVPARERFEAAIRSIQEDHGDTDLVVITGDLTARAQTAAYEELRASLANLTLPYRLLLGNGDHRARFRAVFPDVPVDENGFVQSVLDTDAGRLIFLDTLDRSGPQDGTLCDKRLAWLGDRIAEATGRPLYIFMHHPPFPVGMARLDRMALRDGDALAAVLAKADVRHMFFGHLHRTIAGSWRGIPISVCPSTTVAQIALRLTPSDQRGGAVFEPPLYSIALIASDQVVVHFHDYLYQGPRVLLPPMPADFEDEAVVASYDENVLR